MIPSSVKPTSHRSGHLHLSGFPRIAPTPPLAMPLSWGRSPRKCGIPGLCAANEVDAIALKSRQKPLDSSPFLWYTISETFQQALVC